MSVPWEATRSALALVLVIHAVAHLPGFLVPWHLAVFPDLPYRTTVFNGAVDVGESGVRLVGVLWLFNAVGIVAAAVLVFRGNPHWPPLTVSMLVFSLMLCTLGLPETRIGLAVDVVLLLAVILTVGAV
jgi:hypothetical protein